MSLFIKVVVCIALTNPHYSYVITTEWVVIKCVLKETYLSVQETVEDSHHKALRTQNKKAGSHKEDMSILTQYICQEL